MLKIVNEKIKLSKKKKLKIKPKKLLIKFAVIFKDNTGEEKRKKTDSKQFFIFGLKQNREQPVCPLLTPPPPPQKNNLTMN